MKQKVTVVGISGGWVEVAPSLDEGLSKFVSAVGAKNVGKVMIGKEYTLTRVQNSKFSYYQLEK